MLIRNIVSGWNVVPKPYVKYGFGRRTCEIYFRIHPRAWSRNQLGRGGFVATRFGLIRARNEVDSAGLLVDIILCCSYRDVNFSLVIVLGSFLNLRLPMTFNRLLKNV
jgi:hypothetical protein